jgi:hypothetical protein
LIRSFIAAALAGSTTIGCWDPVEIRVPSSDGGSRIDCGAPLTSGRTIALGPVAEPAGNTQVIEVSFRSEAPIVAINLQVYVTLDEVTWRPYTSILNMNLRDGSMDQVRYLECTTFAGQPAGPLYVRFRAPTIPGARFAVVGNAESAWNASMRFGARGRTGEGLPCQVSPDLAIRCTGDLPCPNGTVNFSPVDDPTGRDVQICAQPVR